MEDKIKVKCKCPGQISEMRLDEGGYCSACESELVPISEFTPSQHIKSVDMDEAYDKLHAENEELKEKYQKAMETAMWACGTSEPSEGRTWVDELAGLLNVTRGQRDLAEKRLSQLGA